MKKMIVIDGNSIMFRAFFATFGFDNVMQARSGLYTNAIYGFVNMINKITQTPDMTNIFVAFDKGKKTFRHQAYEEYKAGRQKTPYEFLMQIPYIKEYLDVLNIKRLELDDFEADDIVGSMALKASPYFDEIMVISGDRDLLQLAKNNIHVYMTHKGLSELNEYNKDNFKEKMGFDVEYMTDYKALIGDKSDNLPGVAGIGDVTAVKLISQYGTIENIYEHIDEIKGKLQEKLIVGKELAFKTKFLATIKTDVELPYSIDDTIYNKPNKKLLREFYEKVDFASFIKRLDNETDDEEVIDDKKNIEVQLNNHYNEIDQLKEQLKKAPYLLMEAELSGENYHKEELLGISIVIDNDGYFVSTDNIDDELKDLLENSLIYAVDIKKLYVSLLYHNIHLKNFGFDLTLGAYIVNPSYGSNDVKTIYEHFFPTNLASISDIYGKKSVYQIPIDSIYMDYAISKASLLLPAKEKIDQILKGNDQLDLLYNMEIKLAKVLGDMEYAGFMINPERLNEIGDEFKQEMNQLERAIYELCGEEFNIASPKQLGVILFEKLQLGKGKKNKTGYSTSADELEKLAKKHPVPKLILEYRKYAKLYSTYVVGLINEISPKDQKLHTIFKQSLTLTGRLSSTEPNIQNIPIRTEEGRLIRSAFTASHPKGMLVSADYSQIELRVLAHLSHCKNMIESFNHGDDLHARTASKIFMKELDEVTKEERRMAKAVNFGIVYGMSPWGLAEEIGISATDASEFINRYFDIYPEIKSYLDEVVNNCRINGYTSTYFNRRRYIPEISSSNGALRQFGERTSKNAPIQGTAADIIKYAMINVDQAFKDNKLKSQLIAQVHDELIVDCVAEEIEIVKKILKETMETVIKLDVKLNAEVSFGFNWDMK